ncbi:unnamed protein product [Notodromas monacha]|uniref:Ubiquitin-like protein ATG12 n=1 Tax=Notodromas monacha TaxID=399045 RepID=A0A7R9GH59_9CRUS|nr:unnamed protein product [Notodromas monacha]CAG0920579.1 unnamed protein product [Notodromas monacha]
MDECETEDVGHVLPETLEENPPISELPPQEHVEESSTKNESQMDDKPTKVLLKPTGGAPVKKQKKFLLPLDQTFAMVLEFMRTKYLNLAPNDSLFVYVNQTFAPSPDQRLQNLYDCFAVEGKLVLYYCLTKAWG